MNSSQRPSSTAAPNGRAFFVTGGTMEATADSYVERLADTEIVSAMSEREFCYVLTAHQMGKSSLFSRAAPRLRQGGAKVCYLDLSGVGKDGVTIEQFYYGLLSDVGQAFGLEDKIWSFCEEHSNLSPQQLWLQVIRHVLLAEIEGVVTIIVDEIDHVRGLSFPTDDFFIGIRALYNQRAEEPELKRLCFCLLGAASPSDLISNKELTPFNVGVRIELRDFTEEEALRLAKGITEVTQEVAETLVRRVFYWTRGQPYLTQKICKEVALHPEAREVAAVDRIVTNVFLSPRARDTDHNFTSARDLMLKGDLQSKDQLLRLYRRVWRGERVPDLEVKPGVAHLKLSGLVRGENGRLVVKNPIYRRIFDARWVGGNLSINWWRIAAIAGGTTVALLLFACLPLALWALGQRSEAVTRRTEAVTQANEADTAKKAALSLADSERAAQESAHQARRQAQSEAAQARKSDAERADAFARLYQERIINLWKGGRRFVEASFLERYATDPAADVKITSAQINLPDVKATLEDPGTTFAGREGMVRLNRFASRRLRNVAAGKAPSDNSASLQPASDAEDANPATWFPRANHSSWLEPAGTFRAGYLDVKQLVPWPQGHGFLIVSQDGYRAPGILWAWSVDSGKPDPAQKFPLLDFYMGHLPEASALRSFAVNADETRLLMVEPNGDCNLWELDPTPMPVEGFRLGRVQFGAPTGRGLVYVDSLGILWHFKDIRQPQPHLLRLPVAGSRCKSLALSPGGELLLVGEENGPIVEWSLSTSKPSGRTWNLPQAPSVLSFSRDGSHFLASAGQREVCIFRVDASEPVARFSAKAAVESAAWSPDGTQIAIAHSDGGTSLWTVNSSDKSFRIALHADMPPVFPRSLFRALLSMVRQQAFSGSLLRLDCRHRKEVSVLPDGRFVIPAMDGSVVATWKKDVADRSPLEMPGSQFLGVVVGARHGRLYYAARNGTQGQVSIFEPTAGAGFRRLTVHPYSNPSSDNPFQQLRQADVVAVCSPLGVVAWADQASQRLCLVKPGEADDLAWFADVKQGVSMQIWNAHFLESIPDPPLGNGTDSTRAAPQPPTSPPLETRRKSSVVTALAFSSDGVHLAVGFEDGEVALFKADSSSSKPPRFRPVWRKNLGFSEEIIYLAISRYSDADPGILHRHDWLVAGDEHSCSTFQIEDDALSAQQGQFWGPVAVAPDGSDFIGRTIGGARWGSEVREGSFAQKNLLDSGKNATALAWSPDGAWQAAGLEDGCISLAYKGVLVETIPAFEKSVKSIAFLPDGSGILAVDETECFRLWKIAKSPSSKSQTSRSADEKHWQVVIEKLTNLKGKPERNEAWKQFICDHERTDALLHAWQIHMQILEWYGRPSPPTAEEVRSVIAPLANSISNLQDNTLLPPELSSVRSLAPLLLRSSPPDQQAVQAASSLLEPHAWLLYQQRLEEWSSHLGREISADLWYTYSKHLGNRLEHGSRSITFGLRNATGTRKAEEFPEEWQQELERAAKALEKAFVHGVPSRYEKYELRFLSEFALTAPWLKGADELAELAKDAADAFSAADTDLKKRDALAKFDDLVKKRGPVSHLLLRRVAIAHRFLGELDRAEEYLNLAEKLPADSYGRADFALCWAYHIRYRGGRGWREKAYAHAKRATEEAPDWSHVWSSLAEFELETWEPQGRLKAAIRDVDRAVSVASEQYPDGLRELLMQKSSYLAAMGRSREARQMAGYLLSPSSPKLYVSFWRWWSYLAGKDREWAESKLEEGVNAARQEVRTGGEFREAERIETFESLAQSHTWVCQKRADTRWRWGVDLRGAVLDYGRALEYSRDPVERTRLVARLGDCLRQLGDLAGAERCIESAIRLREGDQNALHARGTLRLHQERLSESLEAYSRAHDAWRRDSETARNAGVPLELLRLQESGRNLEALSKVTRLLEGDSNGNQNHLHLMKAELLQRVLEKGEVPQGEVARRTRELRETLVLVERLLRPAGWPANVDASTVGVMFGATPLNRTHLFFAVTNAVLGADPEKREAALVSLCDAISTGWYDAYLLDFYPEFRVLRNLPEWPPLREALRMASLRDLSERELRLADWMESLSVRGAKARQAVQEAASLCRKRSQAYRIDPLQPDWKDILSPDGMAKGGGR